MEDDIAIKVEHVSKSFKLPHEKHSSIKSALINFGKSKRGYESQKVLHDISFEIKKGEFFGIVGRNGSGKSTLLKLLAGIYRQDTGGIAVDGKITPFIELGVGFNPELTGRENVFLNGALLGFNRAEMMEMYDEIVSFAELGRFMDQKLKNYSSGMQVRLAFSIAIQAKGEILILDEVLAVGDEAFQQKCLSVFEQYKAQKKTIVLVTHDMSVVQRFCSRALMLQNGEVVEIGSPGSVAHRYSELNKQDLAEEKQKSNKEIADANIRIELLDYATRQKKKRFKQGDIVTMHLAWDYEDVRNIGISLVKQSGEYIFGPNTTYEPGSIKRGAKELYFSIQLTVMTGEYLFKLGISGGDSDELIKYIDRGPSVFVEPNDNFKWGGLVRLPYAWGDKNVKLQ